MRKTKIIIFSLLIGSLPLTFTEPVHAATPQKTSWSLLNLDNTDTDADGLSDWKETNLYNTDPNNLDTDGDSYPDGQELMKGYNPNAYMDIEKLHKHIYISIKKQELRYYTGPYLMGDFLVSTGVRGMDTPLGEYSILKKAPTVLYRGTDYNYPNTKWNLMFKRSYYIHGAYWHRNFGSRMSHGCVNVSYADVKALYDWSEVATPVTILNDDFVF